MRTNPKSELLGEVDVAIIGGGPAGCSTALHLQQMDPDLAARAVLLEGKRHPREKICGGALTLNAERVLAELDVELNMPFAPVHHVQLVYGNATIDLPEEGCAKRVIRRCEFDGALFQETLKRGFPSFQDIRVKKVSRHPEHLRVTTDRGHFRAQVVVGADGVGAVLRKTRGFGPGKMGRLWVAEIPVDPAVTSVFTEQILVIDLSYVREGLKGYFWEFPCYLDERPFVSTGIVDSNPDTNTRKGGYRYLNEILLARGHCLDDALWKAFPIRHFNSRERFSRPRMLLVGDALGSDPLFSEGISQALEFGKLAAGAVVRGFRHHDLSFAKYTREVLRSRVGRELTAYVRAARLFYGPHAELLLSMLHTSPELRELIGCSYAGTQDMHRSTIHIAKLLAKHLFHAKRSVKQFRTAAALDDSKPPTQKAEAVGA